MPSSGRFRAAQCVVPTAETESGRWFGKLRRRNGAALALIFHKPRAQWPGRNRTQALLILRAGNFLPNPRDNPRKWGPGKGDYEHEVLIWSRPRRRFGDFAAAGKVTRRPQAAKFPAQTRSIQHPIQNRIQILPIILRPSNNHQGDPGVLGRGDLLRKTSGGAAVLGDHPADVVLLQNGLVELLGEGAVHGDDVFGGDPRPAAGG